MSEPTRSSAPANASQYGHASDGDGASRTRSGSNARRLRSGPSARARKTLAPPIATTSTASPMASPRFERELTPNASAPTVLRPTTSDATSTARALTRMRVHASPISARSSVRIAPAIADTARTPAALAGAIAKTHATPAIANVAPDTWKPWITTAAPMAVAPEPSSATIRRGSLPTSASSGAATAAAPVAYNKPLTVCVLEATTMGMRRYSTTIASTDHTACATADAAGGAVTAVLVTHD